MVGGDDGGGGSDERRSDHGMFNGNNFGDESLMLVFGINCLLFTVTLGDGNNRIHNHGGRRSSD